MGALPSVKRFYAEDYKESDESFKRFLGQVNLFSEPIYNILNGAVEVSTNTSEEIYTLNVSEASATASDNTFLFTPKKFIGAPNGILVGQCLLSASVPTANIGVVGIDWVWTGSQVSILAIHNLSAGESYTLSLRIY